MIVDSTSKPSHSSNTANMNVRLSAIQQQKMADVFQDRLQAGAEVWLFGSRTDLNKRGGDIDLFIKLNQEEHEPLALIRQLRIALQQKMGERKIDIIVQAPNLAHSTIHDIAQSKGVLLWTNNKKSATCTSKLC
jgi:hypothetical protein